MKCSNCNAEWTVPQNISRSLTNCPFCGEALAPPEPKQLNTVEDVLIEITTRFGMDTLRNGQRTVALFSDLSPNMRRERLLLSYLIQADGNIKLLEVRNKAGGEQQACFLQVCKPMVDEQFVAEDAARKICLSFSTAIGLTIHVEKPEVATPAVKPASSPESSLATAAIGTPPSKTTAPTRPPVPTTPLPASRTPISRPTSAPTTATRINSFAQYQKALEDYYLSLGKAPLSESQIRYFLSSNSLDRVWGITVSEVQKDLKDIYAKYNPKVPTPKRSTKINSFAQYQKALEDYYIHLGKVPLTESQIRYFISSNSLDHVWGITIFDVQKDLKDIYAKYNPTAIQPKPTVTSTTTLTFPTNMRIHTYAKYLTELEQAYLRNGKVMLTKEQIMAFLDAYSLRKNFGIRVSEVETDLREIAKKYS